MKMDVDQFIDTRHWSKDEAALLKTMLQALTGHLEEAHRTELKLVVNNGITRGVTQ